MTEGNSHPHPLSTGDIGRGDPHKGGPHHITKSALRRVRNCVGESILRRSIILEEDGRMYL